jgi:hypothetical protein
MRHGIFLSSVFAAAISAHAGELSAPAAASNPAPAVATLDPVFDCYHTNSAWGFILSGKVIDRKGKVWSYGKRGQAWLPMRIKEGDASYLTAKDLQAKFLEAKEAGSVEAKVLTDNAALIAKAAQGKLTQADTGTRDAGTSTCHAYVHDEAKQRYRDIDLGSDGGASDVHTTNSTAEAQTLLTWLESAGVAKGML